MSRKRITIEARELGEMKVNYLSLVKRGANRVPFRITKSGDNAMINLDLSTIFQKKEEEVSPAVVAIAIAKGADAETYTTALKEAGFEVVTVKNDENSEAATIMLIDGDLPEDARAIKLDDDAALILTGVAKGLDTFPDSNDFLKNVQGAGFFPSFRTATDLLHATMGNIAFSDGDAETTKSAITKALSDFQGYVETLLSAVPEEAFKAEEAVGVAKGLLIGATNPPEEEKKKGGKKKAPAAEAPAEDKGDDKKEAKKDDSGDDVADDAAVDAGEDSVEKSDDSAELSTVLAALQSSIDSVAQAVKAQGDANEGLSQRLDALDARIEKAEGDVRGTVHSEGNDDVSAPEGKAEARKWDNTLLDYGEGVEFA